MIAHLKGRPCRTPSGGGMEADVTVWSRVTCSGCQESRKYARLREADEKKVRRKG